MHPSVRRLAAHGFPAPTGVRHLLGIKDLKPIEFTTLVRNAETFKNIVTTKHLPYGMKHILGGKTIAMMFSKRSTRTRLSTETAVGLMGGNPMFLGKDDIQLGVNETVHDTAAVMSTMVSGIFARVHEHSEVADLAKASSVPIINALSTDYHPLQTIADFQSLCAALAPESKSEESLGLEGKKVAWVGDANNVIFDLASAAMMTGVKVSVATPAGYEIPDYMREIIKGCGKGTRTPGELIETTVPEEAIKDADVIVTDTWTSMGWEDETAKRLKAFEGFQVTEELAKRGGAKKDWKFLHCLPRHQEEVSDEVFYGPRSWVLNEAQNRVWSAMAVIEAFIYARGRIDSDVMKVAMEVKPDSSLTPKFP